MLKKILHVGGGDDDKDAAPKASSTHKETLSVKGEFISYIIGAGGAQIKEIRDKAGSDVKIDIPKGKAPQDDVTITITGSEKSHVTKAKKEIEHVVKHRNKDLKKDTKLHDKAYSDVDKHAEKRNKYYEESKAAFAAGDKEKAKKLSELGKKEQEKMDAAKEKAGAKVAKKKNKDSEPNEIDLHGLQVSEALKAVEKKKTELKKKGKYSEMIVITGAGIHSEGGVSKVASAVQNWAKENNLKASSVNNGSLKIQI